MPPRRERREAKILHDVKGTGAGSENNRKVVIVVGTTDLTCSPAQSEPGASGSGHDTQLVEAILSKVLKNSQPPVSAI